MTNNLLGSVRATPSFIWKHLDNVVLIFAGILFAFGGYIGSLASFLHLPDSLGPVTVGMLALLAWSQIRIRDKVSQVTSTWKRNRTDLFAANFPQEYLDAQTRVSSSYFYSGTTMQRTITAMREHLKRILTQGGTVRILLPDPNDQPLLEMIAKTHPDKTARSIGDDIRNAFRIAQDLEQSHGGVALRTVSFPPHIGINALDVGLPAAMIMIQMYEFKGTNERSPIFLLNRDDGRWFDHFGEQVERLWNSGTVYPITGNSPPISMSNGSPAQNG